jgi:hypothetical protein
VGRLVARLSCRVGAGFHGCGRGVLLVGAGRCWSAGIRQGLEPLQGVGDHAGLGRFLRFITPTR